MTDGKRIGSRVGIALTLAGLLCVAPRLWSACPDYTKKDAAMGQSSSLPQGFLLYGLHGGKGVYRTPLDKFDPKLISGTQDDEAEHISLSDDGSWFFYGALNSKRFFVTRLDGTGRAQVPTKGDLVGRKGMAGGLFRKNPLGGEVFYKSGDNAIRAVPMRWEGGKAVFGAERTLAQFGLTFRNNVVVVGNHMFARLEGSHFVTIPDGGKGQAGDGDIWKPKGTVAEGCEESLSYDGSLACHNPGGYGDPACVPHEGGGNWHKGFVVTGFLEKTSPSVTMSDLVMKQAKSINWVPSKYRYGSVWEIDFGEWSFTNDKNYVVGAQGGEKTPVHGVWMVHWSTNTWTLVTSDKTKAVSPVAYFQGSTALHSGAGFLPRIGKQESAILRADALGRLETVAAPIQTPPIRAGDHRTTLMEGTRKWMLGE